MAGRISTVFGCLIAVVALLQLSAAQSTNTTHTVGDRTGWNIPSNPNFYTTWASGKTFKVGETLLFNFMGVHTVAEVSKADYDSCNTGATPIGSVLTTSPSTVRLNTTGAHYYICTIGRHCLSGQKLSINVAASTPTATPPSTTATPPSIATTPPTTTTTTTPTPPMSPTGGPSASTTPGNSAAPLSVVVGGFSFTLLSAAIAMFL